MIKKKIINNYLYLEKIMILFFSTVLTIKSFSFNSFFITGFSIQNVFLNLQDFSVYLKEHPVLSELSLNSWLCLGLMILISMGVIFSKNPISSLMFLILTYVLSSIILIVYGLEFMGLLLVIVYVGAVAVLFLFVIMMLKFEKVSEYKVNKTSGFSFKVLFFGFVIFYSSFFFYLCPEDLLYTLKRSKVHPHQTEPELFQNLFVSPEVLNEINQSQQSKIKSNVDIELSKIAFNIEDVMIDDLITLGLNFYTTYSYIFLMCGVILLVSIVAPILLTFKSNTGRKLQNNSYQVERKKLKAIKLKDL